MVPESGRVGGERVARVRRRVDGLPFAIGLAAARPRALIAWSHARCSERERLLWARASVFAGGLDLAAAEAVCSGDGIAREDVPGLVAALAGRSVLIRRRTADGVRYRMPGPIRQYGRERLAELGEETRTLGRHRAYYRDLAARSAAELFGPDQVRRFARLRGERADLRAALEYCFAEPEAAATGLAMATDLLHHWLTGHRPAEGRRWLAQGLAAWTEPDDLRARALCAAARLAVVQGDADAAEEMLDESRALAGRLGLETDLGHAALLAGMIAMARGRPDEAIIRYEEALDRHRLAGEPAGVALALVRLCLTYALLGDSPRAIAHAQECLAVCDAHGEGWHRAYATLALGIVAWRRGDLPRATDLAREALRFVAALDDLPGTGIALEVLAWTAAAEERHDRAARLLGAASGVWRAGMPLPEYGHLTRHHDECETAVREALGDAAFRRATRRGERLSHAAALAYALEERRPSAGVVRRRRSEDTARSPGWSPGA